MLDDSEWACARSLYAQNWKGPIIAYQDREQKFNEQDENRKQLALEGDDRHITLRKGNILEDGDIFTGGLNSVGNIGAVYYDFSYTQDPDVLDKCSSQILNATITSEQPILFVISSILPGVDHSTNVNTLEHRASDLIQQFYRRVGKKHMYSPSDFGFQDSSMKGFLCPMAMNVANVASAIITKHVSSKYVSYAFFLSNRQFAKRSNFFGSRILKFIIC